MHVAPPLPLTPLLPLTPPLPLAIQSLEAGNLTSKHAPTLKRGRESSLAGEMRRQGGDIGSRTRFGKFVDGIFHISEHTRVKHEREIRPPSADKLRGGKSAGKASKKASGGKKKKKFRR